MKKTTIIAFVALALACVTLAGLVTTAAVLDNFMDVVLNSVEFTTKETTTVEATSQESEEPRQITIIYCDEEKEEEVEETTIENTGATKEPSSFCIMYREGRTVTKEDLSTEDLNNKEIQVEVPENVRISIDMTSNEEDKFYLTKSYFIVKEGDEIVDTQFHEHMYNIWWHVTAGQSADCIINCGTDEDPDWVTFSIETIVK